MKVSAFPRQCLLLFLLCLPQLAPADSQPAPEGILASQIDYRFVGHLGKNDGEGRLLVWEGTIEGGVSGTMKWWFIDPPVVADMPLSTGRLSFYSARWEVWADGNLVLAGESAGKTVFPDGADGIWDGHGRVTEAFAPHEDLVGRQIYETGPVILGSDPPVTFNGTGTFVVY
jgi:hypothetical protein